MNKADSERLGGQLEALGLVAAESAAAADVVVINTCSVRQTAEERAQGKLGYLKGLRKQRPDQLIVLTGCMVPKNHEDLKRRWPFVDFFLPPLEWQPLITALRERGNGQASEDGAGTLCAVGGEFAPRLPAGEHGPTRWVPIIYGCDNFCTYCIVPFRRGREKSRPIDEIEAEVRALVAQGAKEVTLLGQNVDSYGHDLPGKPDLADLLTRLNDIEGLARIRFLTSHPKDMSDRLIDAVASLPKVCEHINLPFQAGDDRILGLMRRGYAVSQYRDLVGRIRDRIPNVALSTDLIVGFPSETAAEFENSLQLVADLRFDVVHAAMYSPRPGTAASRMADDVPPEEKRRRLDLVEALQEKISLERNQALVGSDVEVLVERRTKGKWEGRTRTDKLVFFSFPRDLVGELVTVRVGKASAWSLQGELVE